MTNSKSKKSVRILKEVETELRTYATLLTSIDNDCIDSNDLVGLGVNLEKLHGKVRLILKILDAENK